MPINYIALKTEIDTDPQALGYAPLKAVGDCSGIAALLNLARAGVLYQVNREPLAKPAVFAAFVPAELTALTATQLQLLQLVLSLETVDLQDANTRTILANLFPAGSTTRANLVVLQKRQGSRAEVLFGRGTGVTHEDVAIALRS